MVIGHFRYSLAPADQPGFLLHYLGSFSLVGVDLFFAISGFIITLKLSSDSNQMTLRNLVIRFYISRLFQILPLFYIVLFVIICISFLFSGNISKSEIVSSFFFFRNYLTGSTSWYTAHFWSLSVEEHFYIVYPIFFIFFARKNLIRGLLVCCLIVAVWKYLDAEILKGYAFKNSSKIFRTDLRVDSIIWGGLAGLVTALIQVSKPTYHRAKSSK